MMETNFFAPMRLVKLCLPHMRERRSGCIVNVSSITGIYAMPTQVRWMDGEPSHTSTRSHTQCACLSNPQCACTTSALHIKRA